jgi:regulator of protease activity HflC (stomatin/prohibitin superfamily)
VQSERKQKEDDALSEIQRKTQQSEADNKNIIDQAKAEAEAIKLKTEAEAEAIENERKGLDIFTKKAEIQSNANAKIINGLSSLLGNMKNMKGVFLPDYTGVHTIINGSGRENKNDDFLLSMFKGILVKYLDAELETELKTVSRKKNV